MDDLISRQAAIRFIRDKVSLSLFMKRSVDKADKACMELCEMLDRELPSVEVEPVKKGKWIRERRPCIFSQTGSADWLTCSVCGERFSTTEVNKEKYCRNCGAKMEGADHE